MRLPAPSRLCSAMLFALGYAGASTPVAANDIATSGRTATTVDTDGDVTNIRTTTASGDIGFNSFRRFSVDAGKTVNLHHLKGTRHLVNLVHDQKAVLDGTINSLVDGKLGGHLLFADPHGIVVGASGTINAGRLSLTTPDADFLDEVVSGDGTVGSSAAQQLVGGDIPAERIDDDGVIRIEGRINATTSARLRAGEVHVPGHIEAGTEAAATAAGQAIADMAGVVNVSGVVPATAAAVHGEGVVEITAEGGTRITADRDSIDPEGNAYDFLADPEQYFDEPLEDDDFAVSVSGTVNAAHPAPDPATDTTPPDAVTIRGQDVRIAETAAINATDADGAVSGRVRIDAEHEREVNTLNPNPGLFDGENVDIRGSIEGGHVEVSGRYLHVAETGRIEAKTSAPAAPWADGDIAFDARSELSLAWGLAPTDARVRIDGDLRGRDLLLSAYAESIANGFENPAGSAGGSALSSVFAAATGLAPAGAAVIADANAEVSIGSTGALRAERSIDAVSSADRNARTAQLGIGGSFGIGAIYGSLRGSTRVHVADGATLSTPGEIGLSAHSRNEMNIWSMVANAPDLDATSKNHALAFSYGDADVTTEVKVDHGARLTGEPDGNGNPGGIGGLSLVADTRNSFSLVSKAYAVSGDGAALTAALGFMDTDTRAILNADVMTAQPGASAGAASGDVNVVARSITDYYSVFSVSQTGLSLEGTLLAGATYGAGKAREKLGFLKDAVGSGAAATDARNQMSLGVSVGVAYMGGEGKATAGIGVDNGDGQAPEIDAAGDVSVHARQITRDVHIAGGAANNDMPLNVFGSDAAYALGIGITRFENSATTRIGSQSVVSGERVGVGAVSDMPLEVTFFDEDEAETGADVLGLLASYLNSCFGVCSNVTTSWIASASTSSGESSASAIAGNLNVYIADNQARTIIDDGAQLTARGAVDNDRWTIDLPGLPDDPSRPDPFSDPQEAISLTWRDELDLRSYSRVEGVHVAGNFGLITSYFGTLLGNDATPMGGSLNFVRHDNRAITDVGAARLEATADGATVGIRSRNDDAAVVVSPSSGAGGGLVVNLLGAGLAVDTVSRATVAPGARVRGDNVIVAADQGVDSWVISGQLTMAGDSGLGFSVAAPVVDSEITARVGDAADGDDTQAVRPSAESGHTVKADRLVVRARSSGDFGALAIQVMVPGVTNTQLYDTQQDGSESATGNIFRSGTSGSAGLFGTFNMTRWLGPVRLFSSLSSKPVGTASESGSLKLAGALSLVTTDIDTTATVRGVRIGSRDDTGEVDVAVSAVEQVDRYSVAGAGAMQFLQPGSVGDLTSGSAISGAISLQHARDSARATLEGVRIDRAGSVDVAALRRGQSIVVGLALSAALPSTDTFASNYGGSLSLHVDRSDVTAAVRNSDVLAPDTAAAPRARVDVLAAQGGVAGVGGGAGMLGGARGVGVTVGAAVNDREITAEVTGSRLGRIPGDPDAPSSGAGAALDSVTVQARRASRTYAVAAAASALTSQAAAGSIASIISRDTVDARIGDTRVEATERVEVSVDQERVDPGDIPGNVGLDMPDAGLGVSGSPEDQLDFGEAGTALGKEGDDTDFDEQRAFDLAVAGSIGQGRQAAGASLAVTVSRNDFTARIEDSTIAGTPANVLVDARNDSRALAVSVSGTLSSGAGLALTAASNVVDNDVTAELVGVNMPGSGTDAPGTLIVRAHDDGEVRSIAGAAAFSTSSSLAPALAVNHVKSTRTAGIVNEPDGGDAGSGGASAAGPAPRRIHATDVTVEAVATGSADASAVGVALSTSQKNPDTGEGGATIGGAASVPINVLTDTVEARISRGARVTAVDSVAVSAAAEQRVRATSVSAAVSGGGLGVGVAAPFNRIATRVDAHIGDPGGGRTLVTALGNGEQEVRSGTLAEDVEPRRFETLSEVSAPTLEMGTERIRGVAVRATSLQSSATIGASVGVSKSVGASLGLTGNKVDGHSRARIRNADINDDPEVTSEADARQRVTVAAASEAWSADAAVVAALGKDGAGAATLALSGVSRETLAEIDGSTVRAEGDLDVDARTRIVTSLLGIGASGSSGVAAVAAQAGVIRQAATTLAKVRDADIEAGRVQVRATGVNDTVLGLGTAAGAKGVGVGIGLGIVQSAMTTQAIIGPAAGGNEHDRIITDGGDVLVDALTHSTLRSYVMGVAVGGGAGIAGSITYNGFSNNTVAALTDDDPTGEDDARLQLGSGDSRIGRLRVRATELVGVKTIAGSVGIGKGLGAGGAAAMIGGRSRVRAVVEDADVWASDIDIVGKRFLELDAKAASLAAGGVAGLAGGVTLITLGDTSFGALEPELDGSAGALGEVVPGDPIQLDEALLDADSQAAITEVGGTAPAVTDDESDDLDRVSTTVADAVLDSAGNIDVIANTHLLTLARAGAGAGAIGGGAGVGVAATRINSRTRADVVDGTNLTADGAVRLAAAAHDFGDGRAIDVLAATGAVAGVGAFSGTFAFGKNEQQVIVRVGDSDITAPSASITAVNEQSAVVKGYAGAAAAGASGSATVARLALEPETKVAIEGVGERAWSVAGLEIAARNRLTWDHTAFGTAIGGVAGLAGAKARADIAAESRVRLDGGFRVELAREYRALSSGIDIVAENTLRPFGAALVAEGFSGGLFAGAFPTSSSTVDLDAHVEVGAGVMLDARGGALDSGGGDLRIAATNELEIAERIRSVAAGLAAVSAGELVKVSLTGPELDGEDAIGHALEQSVTIDDDAELAAARDLLVGTRADLEVDNTANVSAGGFAGGANVDGLVDLAIDHDVVVRRGARLAAYRDIVLDAGSRSITDVSLDTRAYVKGAFGGANAAATVVLDLDASLDVGNGTAAPGALLAGRDARLIADQGRLYVDEAWRVSVRAVPPSSDSGGDAAVTTHRDLRLAMPVEAGYLNDLRIAIDAGGNLTIVDGDTEVDNSDLDAWTDIDFVDDFAPRTAIDQQIELLGPDGDPNTLAVLERLADIVPQGEVAAVQVRDLVASAGNIEISAGGRRQDISFADGASLTASGGPSIEVVNDSSRYLRLIGDVRLRAGEGEVRVSVGDAVYTGNTDLDNVSISIDQGGADRLTDTVSLRNTGEGEPALFLEGAIANPRGTVRLYNETGDLVQYGGVLAARLDIDVPKGSYVVNNRDGFWPSAGGSQLLSHYLAQYEDANPFDYFFWQTLGSFWKSDKVGRHDIDSGDPAEWTDFDDDGAATYTFWGGRVDGDPDDYDVLGSLPNAPAPSVDTGDRLIRADWVGINAKYIDINTNIEAGRASNLSVDLGAGVRERIEQFGDRDGYLELDGTAITAGDEIIGARYNGYTDRIEIDSMIGDGAGAVYLNGHVYSTVRNAKITVHRGGSDIDIDNSTGISVELLDINAGSSESAVVKITDHFRKHNGQALTTWYVDGTEFERSLAQRQSRKYVTTGAFKHWADAVAALRSDSNAVLRAGYLTDFAYGIDGNTRRYSPVDGIVHEYVQTWRARGNGEFSDDDGRNIGVKDEDVPSPVVDWDDEDWIGPFQYRGDESRIVNDDTPNGPDYEVRYKTRVNSDVESDTDCVFVACNRKFWDYSGEVHWADYREIHRMRADHDVGIGFEGAAADIRVESNADVHVGGEITNAAGHASIRAIADDGAPSARIVAGSRGAQVAGQQVTLEADDDIGAQGEALGVETVGGGGLIDVVSHEGSVHLEGGGSSPLRVARVQASAFVSLAHAAGALINAGTASDAGVRGNRVDLDAASMGVSGDGLLVAVAGEDARVDARADDSVRLEAAAGDLPVGAIVAEDGDVTLTAAQGSIRAASDRRTRFDAVVADNEAGWEALGLTSDGVENLRARDLATFESSVESAYARYWQIRDRVDVDDAGRVTAIDEDARTFFAPFAEAAGVGVEAWIAGELERIDGVGGVFDQAFAQGRPATLDEYDPKIEFSYDASAHVDPDTGQTVADTVMRDVEAWTLDELAAPLPGNVAQETAANVLANTPRHIDAGGDVSLVAAGDVGRVLDDLRFEIADRWDLSNTVDPDAARAAVLSAGTGDITCREVGGDACDTVDGRFDLEIGNGQTYEFTVRRREPLRVDAAGTLNVDAGGSVMVGDGDTDNGMSVGTVDAEGELRLLSTAPITAAAGAMLRNAAGGLWMTSATGAIGSADDPIAVAIDGAVQDAVASGGVYLDAARADGHGGTLALGRIAATEAGTGTIAVSGGDGGYTIERASGLPGPHLNAAHLVLDYTGTFGGVDSAPLLASGTRVRGMIDGSGALLGDLDLDVADLVVTEDLDVSAPGRVRVTSNLDGGNLDIAAGAFTLTEAATLEADRAITLTSIGESAISGDIGAHSLSSTSKSFFQSGDSFIDIAEHATISTNGSQGDVLLAGVHSGAILEIDAAGSIAATVAAGPHLASPDGGVSVRAAGAIGTQARPLAVNAATLEAGAGGSAYIELLGATDIPALRAGASLSLQGDTVLRYGALEAGHALTFTDFAAVLGDGALRSDDPGTSLLTAGGEVHIDAGTIGAAGGFDGTDDTTRIVGAGGIDLDAATIDLDEVVAGAWTGGAWGEGEVGMTSGIIARATDRLEVGLARATGDASLIAPVVPDSATDAGRVRVDDLVTLGRADLVGRTVEVTTADIATDLTIEGAVSTVLGTVTSGGGQTHTDGANDNGRVEWTGLLDAGGTITVDVGGEVAGGDVDGEATLALTGASVDAGTLSTVGGQTLTASDFVNVDHLVTETGALEARADRIRMASSVETGAEARLIGGTRVSIGSLTTSAGADAVVRADDIFLNTGDIAGNLDTVALERVELRTVTTGGDQAHRATGDSAEIAAGDLIAGGSILLDGEDSVAASDLTVTDAGDVTVVGGRKVEVRQTNGGGALSVDAAGDLDLGQLRTSGPITLDAGGDVSGGVYHLIDDVAGLVDGGGALTVTAGANIDLTDVSATGAQTLRAGGDVTVDRLTGGDRLLVNGGVIDIVTVDTEGRQDYTGDRFAYDSLEAGAWDGTAWGEGRVERDAGITATVSGALGDGRARATGEVAFVAAEIDSSSIDAGSVDLEATADDGGVRLADLRTTGAADLTGATIDLADADVGGSLNVAASDAITLGAVDSGAAQTYTDGRGDNGAVTWTELVAADDIRVDVGGDVAGRRLEARGAVRLAADGVDLERLRAERLTVDAQTLEAGALEAAFDIELDVVRDIMVFELLESGGDLDVDAGGRWTFATLKGGGDLEAEAGGAIDGGRASVGGTAFLRAGYTGGGFTRNAEGGTADAAGIALDGLTAEYARLHTAGELAMPGPDLERGVELRAAALGFDHLQADGGRYSVDVTGATGGAMQYLELQVDGADQVAFDRLYARSGRLGTDSDRVDLDRAWVSGEMAVETAMIDVLVKNDAPVMQRGYEVQLYAERERFWLRQDGMFTDTNARILRAAAAPMGRPSAAAEAGKVQAQADRVPPVPGAGPAVPPGIALDLRCTGRARAWDEGGLARADCLPRFPSAVQPGTDRPRRDF